MIPLLPPGETSRIEAERVLVLAPHFDDEVLGCGGLLLHLLAATAEVRVLFLTDSGATVSPGEERSVHAALRRREADSAGRSLGITGAECLGLPDGALADHLEPAAAAIRQALVSLRPNLLLVPSPLELTADHRAAFAALYRVLAQVRDSASKPAEAALLARLTVLAYEVNRPLYPNVLVDVTAVLPRLEAAMGCYASQEGRHPYWRSRLGLSRYRTLSLAPDVEAAEAYVRLEGSDFTTFSLAQLIRNLGGEPDRLEIKTGPRLSVVVRTRDRPELLAEALSSLAANTYRNAEVVLVNDGGRTPEVPADFPFDVVPVNLPSNRGRAKAAQAGVEAASGDFVCFLDDDDLVAPEHLATLAGLVSGAGVRVAYTDAAVGVYELGEGGWRSVERRLPYSRDFDRALLLLDNYIPFHTLVIERGLFARVGSFDETLPFFEDWDFLIRLSTETPFHHLPQVTCEYRHFRGAGHHILGAAAQARTSFLEMKARVLTKHQARLDPALLAAAVDPLRAELVALGEERLNAREELKKIDVRIATAVREKQEVVLEGHRLHGEVVAAQGDVERLLGELDASAREIERLYGEEQRLSADASRLETDLKAQTDLVGRLYAEVARLGGQVQAMEGTRAWRFHQWWQRRGFGGRSRG